MRKLNLKKLKARSDKKAGQENDVTVVKPAGF